MRVVRFNLALSSFLFASVALRPSPATAQQWIILHQFTEQTPNPECTLVETGSGLYVGGYASGLFQLTPAGAFSVLDNFLGSTFNVTGRGPITPASNGYYYGVLNAANSATASAVYRVSSSGEETIINESLTRPSPLIEGTDGNLWGTEGSAETGYSVFKMSLGGAVTVVMLRTPRSRCGSSCR